MKVKILGLDGKDSGATELPAQFGEEIRPDLIERAFLVIRNNKRQAYGNKENAGGLHSAKLSRRRRQYRGSYGFGISRVPRKILSRNGTRFSWQGAVAPGMVGGRRAHPPKAEKIWDLKINRKEKRKAIRSALAATIAADLVAQRGHKLPQAYPFIVSASLQDLEKTGQVADALTTLGFGPDLKRAQTKTVRAGKGKGRGRKYKTKKGPLVVVGENCKAIKACAGIPGVDIIKVNDLNAELLAPGGMPGRLTIFTESAITKLSKERLFE